jgi:acyl-CoA oxidase
MLHAAQAHIDRIILEAFVSGIDSCEDDEARKTRHGFDLYALSVMEEDKAWFVEHRFRSTERARPHPWHGERCRTYGRTPRCWSTVSGS